MNIWIVSREYVNIAEAGGVKNVTTSIAENLARLNHNVTVFIPLYACSDLSHLEEFNCLWHHPVQIELCGKNNLVSFSYGKLKNVNFVFIGNKAFSNKNGVYTYTREDEEKNPDFKQGHGHKDALFLNSFFQKSIVYYGLTCCENDAPDIIHGQDATSAMVPVFLNFAKSENAYLNKFYENTKSIITIHNAGPAYHHEYSSLDEARFYTSLPDSILEYGYNGNRIEPFVLASKYSLLTTVSTEYADEINNNLTDTDGLAEIFLKNNTKIFGITNGMDFESYDTSNKTKSLLPFEYDLENKNIIGKYKCRDYLIKNYCIKNSENSFYNGDIFKFGYLDSNNTDDFVYISYHGRVVYQKGIEVMTRASEILLEKKLPVRFIFIGQGDKNLESKIQACAEKYKGSFVYFRGYNKEFSRLCIASGDFSLQASYFEPCGLEDFISQSLGTLPVAHATGGLKKIKSTETGFLYSPNSPEVLSSILESLVKIVHNAGRDILQNMIYYTFNYIKNNYSWKNVIKDKYIKLYEEYKKK